MRDNCFATIFTPTYNRRDKLPVLLKSLCKQTCYDFEWLIVDDGSSDGTDAYISSLEGLPFSLRYVKKENGGKHTAVNKGVEMANGLVFAIVDSDDYLLENAVETLKTWFREIENLDRFAGVSARKGYCKDDAVGTFGNQDYIDAKSSERLVKNIKGDQFEVFYTEILKQFPFPVFEGERFLTEAVVWNRIASAGYRLRWHRDVLYICEYLEHGLTDQKDRLVRNSPKGYALYICEQVREGIGMKPKLGYYSYYYGVRKADARAGQIAEELQCSKGILYASVLLRKLVYLMKR